jgi:hypothetical protein
MECRQTFIIKVLLATGPNLCQGDLLAGLRKLAELAAGAEDISTFALADEGWEVRLLQHRLKPQDCLVVRPPVGTAGE